MGKAFIAVLVGIMLIAGCAAGGRWGEGRGRNTSLVGTWERLDEQAPQYRHVKMLTPTHFVWVSYDRSNGVVVAMGGGTYDFDGRVYIEHLLFGNEALPAGLVGEDQFFTAKIAGDTWRHEGTLSNGFHVSEVWSRVE
jgi:hypothetical protein